MIPPHTICINGIFIKSLSGMFNGNTNTDTRHPIQNDEHSMHNNIFRKNDGKYFATNFLGFINKSDKDQIQLVPMEIDKNKNKI